MIRRAFGFMLDRAQEAARRQLAAGRMRHSGRAVEELAGVTQGNLMQQFGSLANIYGQGAGAEQGRWSAQTGAGLDAARIRAGALGQAGQIGINLGQKGGAMSRLDLARASAGFNTPMQNYAAAAEPQNVYQPQYVAGAGSATGGGQWGTTPGYQGSYSNWVSRTSVAVLRRRR